MNELEPLCNFEQSKMLKELKFNEPTKQFFNEHSLWRNGDDILNHNDGFMKRTSRPTISLAKNWLWDKYKLWMETSYSPEMQEYCARIWTEDVYPFFGNNANPMIAESDCLTEVLKRLTNEQIHNPK